LSKGLILELLGLLAFAMPLLGTLGFDILLGMAADRRRDRPLSSL